MSSPLKSTLIFIEPLAMDPHIRIIDILNLLKGQGAFCIFMLLSLPFCQPIQIPGFSTPFGITMTVLAIRKIIGKRTWLPKKFSNLTISRKHFNQIIRWSFKLESFLEKVSRPRLKILTRHSLSKMFHLLIIAISSMLLALPLPIPLTNFIFGWIILFTSVGHLMNDGFFILLGDLLLVGLVTVLITVLA